MAQVEEVEDQVSDSYSVTVSVVAQPLHLFVRSLSSLAGVSIVVDSDLENTLVTLDVVEQDIADVIAVVARRLGTEVTKTGDLYFVGDLRPEDRGVYVTTMGHVPPEDFIQIASLLSSDNGRSHVTDAGVAVVSDKVEVLARVAEAVAELKSIRRGAWLLQFHIVETSSRHLESIGWESDASIGAELSTFGSNAFASVTASLENVRDASASTIVAEPVYLVNDSEVVRYERGQEFPVTTVSTTADGVQTSSVDYQSVGSSIEAVVRSLGGLSGVLTVDISDQNLTDETVSGLPIINGYQFADTIDVVSGGTYLLSTFNRQSSNEAARLGWSRAFGDGSDALVSQIWVRVYKVGSEGIQNDGIDQIAVADRADRSGLSEDRTESALDVITLDSLETFE